MWALGSLSLQIIYPTTDFVMKYYPNVSLHAALVYYAAPSVIINRLMISLDSCLVGLI